MRSSYEFSITIRRRELKQIQNVLQNIPQISDMPRSIAAKHCKVWRKINQLLLFRENFVRFHNKISIENWFWIVFQQDFWNNLPISVAIENMSILCDNFQAWDSENIPPSRADETVSRLYWTTKAEFVSSYFT